jgi:hypothetical protein
MGAPSGARAGSGATPSSISSAIADPESRPSIRGTVGAMPAPTVLNRAFDDRPVGAFVAQPDTGEAAADPDERRSLGVERLAVSDVERNRR